VRRTVWDKQGLQRFEHDLCILDHRPRSTADHGVEPVTSSHGGGHVLFRFQAQQIEADGSTCRDGAKPHLCNVKQDVITQIQRDWFGHKEFLLSGWCASV
jgi:hypothetical protein